MKFPWKYITLSFAIGLLLGGSAGLYSARNLAHTWIQKSPQRFLYRLDRELHLTDSQRAQILTVLTSRRDKITAYQDETRKATRAEIRALLTPAQQPAFDAM